jgi:hypothetical protein
MLAAITIIATIAITITTTTIAAYAAEDSDDSEGIENVIKAKNDDGNQAIAIADCDGDIILNCDASAGDITEQEATDGEELCEECLEKFDLDVETVSFNLFVDFVDVCPTLRAGIVSENNIAVALRSAGALLDEIPDIIECLEEAGAVFTQQDN